jgi:Fe-S-cluster containining protein
LSSFENVIVQPNCARNKSDDMVAKMSEKSKYTFKCLEQTCDTKACHIRPRVNVTLGDLARWTAQGYLMNILPGINLRVPQSEEEWFSLETHRKALKNEEEGTACVFYNEDANGCEIRYSRPISCRTYPLEYNGEKFYVTSKDCPGVGKGDLSKEALKEARDLAEEEFQERKDTDAALPAVYSVIMAQMVRQSAEAMSKMSEEDRKKMEEILSREKEQSDAEEPATQDRRD